MPRGFSPIVQLSLLLNSNPHPKMKPSTKDQVSGNAKIATGKVKETTGKIVGNDRLKATGKAEQNEGKVQKAVGKIERKFGQ
jgi:uncharacterized protein YjbJ (UPF0337 family)